ncbi:MAG TPA: TolC family protein [Planctomycetota bacterium]
MQHQFAIAGLILLAASCSAAPRPGELQARARAGAAPRGATAAPEFPAAAVQDPAALLRLGAARNPGLQAAHSRWVAALERVPQAGSLPDPRLTFTGYLAEVETRVGPMQGRVGVSQAIPWFGKLDAAADAAAALAEAEHEALEAAQWDLRARVLAAWSEYAWLVQAVAIAEGHMELLTYLESVSQSRYATGSTSHADVVRVQIEIGTTENRLRSLKDLRAPLVARLNAALDRPAAAELDWPESQQPAALPGALESGAGLGDTHPVLRALRRRIEAAGHRLASAEKERYPDFQVGADWTLIGPARMPGVAGSGEDAFGLTLGVELPIRSGRIQAGIAEARAETAAARAELAEQSNRLAAELAMALYESRDAERRIALYRDGLIPKSEEALQATLGAYSTGEAGFDALIDATRLQIEFQLAAARAEADLVQSLAAAERLSGVVRLDIARNES